MAGRVFLDRAASERRIKELGDRFGWEIDPDKPVGSLSVGWQQRVEILKALYRNARVLVLDEPTAVLTPQETKEIFEVLRKLRGRGLRDHLHQPQAVRGAGGRRPHHRHPARQGGRQPHPQRDRRGRPRRADGRSRRGAHRRSRREPSGAAGAQRRATSPSATIAATRCVRDVSFEVRAGEIFGIAGVAGNGQDELVEAVVGLRHATSGTVTLAGTRHHRRLAADAAQDGSRLRPRRPPSLRDGAELPAHRQPRAQRLLPRPVRARAASATTTAIAAYAKEAIEKYDVRTPSADVSGGTLSGGNQQKVVVAREFEGELKLLVLDQPTRGLDVGSIEFIHRQAIARRDTGVAILLVSAELDEVLEMSDRIGVMFRGQLVAVLDGPTADREEVGLLMATGGRGGGRAAADPGGCAVTAAAPARRPLRPPHPGRHPAAGHRHRPGPRLRRGADDPVQPADQRLRPLPADHRLRGAAGRFGRLAELDRQHAGQCDAAGPRRPGGRHRLQGRPVQHRGPGPVPAGRAVRGSVGRHRA